jgi:hypothetical protein
VEPPGRAGQPEGLALVRGVLAGLVVCGLGVGLPPAAMREIHEKGMGRWGAVAAQRAVAT